MRATWAIFKRELSSHFFTPLAYVLLFVFLVWNGGVFTIFMQKLATDPQVSAARGPMQLMFGGSILYFLPMILFCPAITMKAFAEEHRSGTIESLLTAPVTELQVVMGKFLAAFTVFVTLWAPTLLYALVVRRYGPVDWRSLGAAYGGTMLIGASFLAVGLFMSVLSRSQMVAFILSFAVIGGGMFLLGLGEYVFTEESQQVFYSYVNIWRHMEHFSVGVIDTRQVVYYGSITVVSLMLTVFSLERVRSA